MITTKNIIETTSSSVRGSAESVFTLSSVKSLEFAIDKSEKQLKTNKTITFKVFTHNLSKNTAKWQRYHK